MGLALLLVLVLVRFLMLDPLGRLCTLQLRIYHESTTVNKNPPPGVDQLWQHVFCQFRVADYDPLPAFSSVIFRVGEGVRDTFPFLYVLPFPYIHVLIGLAPPI